ncbi:MAG TPA: cysteine--tRNA ligase [Anaerolineae bacterium]
MTLHVYNRLTQELEPFAPLGDKVVRIYVCGPTVYDQAHIGHAMSAIVFDVIRRYLQYRGYRVIHVMNFTDVDDKIINRAKELGVDPLDLAQRYIDEWLEQVQALNLLPAHHYPRASQTIPQIVAFIQQLIETEYAYVIDGDVFYDVDGFPEYGKLSGRRPEAALAGTRVAVDERKKDAADFALWKAAKPGEPSWSSPWGPGRPGWHIECSAMAIHYLGEQIDIHGGGTDLIFPHHENEIAQSEAATGQKPFARYWLHNGMLQLRGEKMSKSLGNVVTLEAFLARHEADVLRLMVLNGHYRKPLTYGEDVVASAGQALQRLRGGLRPSPGEMSQGEAVQALLAQTDAARAGFREAMDDDFNTAGALSHLFTLVRAINAARDAGIGGEPLATAQATLRELARLLGLELAEAPAEASVEVNALVETLIEVRAELRQTKQWALADAIRDRLEGLGIALEDTPQGTKWYRQES